MKSSNFSKNIRFEVAKRAIFRCEYCQIREEDLFIAFQIDHIISRKHGGGDEIENLAFACPHCNQNKGSDLTTVLENYDDLVKIYNPRKQIWQEHFETSDGEIYSKSKVGSATIKLLKMNDVDLLILRKILSEIGIYP